MPVLITDDLNAQITGSNINWIGNISVLSSNINGGAQTAISDSSGNDEGEFVANILTLRCGDITDSSPCSVTYDIEVNNSP